MHRQSTDQRQLHPQQHARIGIRGRKEIYGRLCTERSGRSAERDLSASGKILRGKDIELILANAAGSIDQQLTDIENFTTNKVDIIIVSALDSNAVVDVCNAARAAGIYVIDYVMGISSEVDVRFGYNFYDMAATQAQACIKYLNENPDATLKIGYIWGSNSMELCQQLYQGLY